jgi:DNA polymerase-3 subunit epsilon/CBS domain-containing protein
MQGSATPLIALDAVAVDTATTGLDPAKCRVVELAALRIRSGSLDDTAVFRRLVAPGIPIPAAATAIHGIDDHAVAAAPSFARIWPEFADFTGEAVMIGHTIGYDLAVLAHECRRAGVDPPRTRSLDTRLLAEVVAPDLPGYSLEQLQAWLELEGSDRHSALGDATLTGRIFLALLPKLRDKGIRTLAEAERASRGLARVLEDHSKAGWVDVTAPTQSGAERSFGEIDSYPYRHRVADVMSAPPKISLPATPIKDVLARMMRERISSLLVSSEAGGPAPWPSETAIVTERDVMRALANHGAATIDLPVERFASRPLQTVPADALAYRAIARMSRLRVRHLGVTDHDGRVCGVVSARDLLRLRAEAAAVLGDEIEQAENVAQLAHAHGRLPHAAASLLAEGIPGRQIAVALSQEICELTRRAAVLAERRLKATGRGDPPCRYALAVLGSAARGESLLAMDQDNALVFADGDPGGEHDLWFEQLGILTTDILHEAGVPYCTGGVMARNPQWRGSVATWRKRIDGWIQHARPEDLLAVDIFFDLQSVHGDLSLGHDLPRYGFEAARGNAAFARLLAEAAPPPEPAVGFFGRIRTRAGRIDLKRSGMFGITLTARVLAICHHVTERSTPARLAGLQALGLGGAADLAALDDAHATFMDLILDQQIADIEDGLRPTNAVEVGRLSSKDQRRLRAALDAVRPLADLTRDMLFRN